MAQQQHHVSVKGLSSLRARESAKPKVETEEQLQDYLKRKYAAGGDAAAQDELAVRKKKKRLKRPEAPPRVYAGVRIVEEDTTGFAPLGRPGAPDPDAEDDEAPVVANPLEAARAVRQLEQARDGLARSGWEEADHPPGGAHRASMQQRRLPDADGDVSPPRRGAAPDGDLSPPRRGAAAATAAEAGRDLSPARRPERGERGERHGGRGGSSAEDLSPPRRRPPGEPAESPDLSPPRGGARRGGASPDLSPPRRAAARGGAGDGDLSPPRGRRPGGSAAAAAADLSPPRRGAAVGAAAPRGAPGPSPDADRPPPRRSRQGGGDLSPPRRSRQGGGDLSPPRRGREAEPLAAAAAAAARDVSPPRRRPEGGPAAGGAAPGQARGGMSDGAAAGLVTGQQLRAEFQTKRQAEAARLAGLDASVSGRNAETVYRDRASGKRVTKEELVATREAERAKKAPEKPVWGGGLAQEQKRAAERAEMAAQAARPFAVTADDAALNDAQRAAIHFGDPMAHLARKRLAQRQGGALPAVQIPEAMRAQLSRTGGTPIPQEVGPHSWLKRGVAAPLNRYGIRPGRHWDGVDRSNGFERDFVRQRNAQAAAQQEYKMWSQADL